MSDFSTQSNPDSYQIRVAGYKVGEVTSGVFKKSISGSRHILRKPRAIALAVESLKQAEQVGASEIQITDKETGKVYSCSIERFKEYSFPIQRGGFEPQLALPIERFNTSEPLDYSSYATKRGEMKRQPGNGALLRIPSAGKKPVELRDEPFQVGTPHAAIECVHVCSGQKITGGTVPIEINRTEVRAEGRLAEIREI